MRRILAGIETEYGLLVEGRGAEEQIEEATALVRGYPGECLPVWDYRQESPRNDMRGFRLDRLAVDPEDAKFDAGRPVLKAEDVRSDRVLPNGARFYNDHGHPEYATPECWSLAELAAHDQAGMLVVQAAVEAREKALGERVRAYKNNTDFHGASYGTHEGYLVPRSLGFDKLFAAVMPMLVVRQVLTGAGKVGAESGPSASYQLSQRADFFVEPANAETLFRRPIFNTRDEPHADPARWARLHVISGDANMIASATMLKVGLVKLALHLAEAECAPVWPIADPVRAFQAISRDETLEFRIELERRSWTTAAEVLESYFAAAEARLDLDDDMAWTLSQGRCLLSDLRSDFGRFRRSVDWAAKRSMLESFMTEEGMDWRDPSLRSYDLEYHQTHPDEGLWHALEAMGEVDPSPQGLAARLDGVDEPTRARARGLAVRKFGPKVLAAGWRSLVFNVAGESVEVDLPPDADYPAQLADAPDVETFIQWLRGVN